MRAASPRLRVAEIRIPVLLVHGEEDNVVPIEQSRIMQGALRKAGKQVTMTTYKMEGHGGWSYENEVQNINEIIAFFRPHLAPPAEVPAGAQ